MEAKFFWIVGIIGQNETLYHWHFGTMIEMVKSFNKQGLTERETTYKRQLAIADKSYR